MHDFGKFCYLDVPKTGSTFISSFLKEHSSLDQVSFKKHGRLHTRDQLEDGKFFFISVREPLDQYKSLYFYGVTQKGALFSQLTREEAELRSFYDGTADGFSKWLRFVMDPENSSVFSARPGKDGRLFGPMTDRFLRLSFYRPARYLKDVTDFDSLVDVYRRHRVHSEVVRNESLNEDMAVLVEGPLRGFIKDPDAAVAELRSSRTKTNASKRVDKKIEFALDADLLSQLRERERFLYEVVGYDRLAA